MSARDEMLGRIRAALGPLPEVPVVPRDYRRGGDPARSDRESLLRLLVDRLGDYRAAILHVADPDAIGGAVAQGLEGAQRVVVPPGLPSTWLPDGLEVIVDDRSLEAPDLDRVDGVITAAAVAIAETGTIVLDGSPDQGRRAITLVPDLHVCVVWTRQVVATVPEGVAAQDPSRPQTWISGPSATSDIELNRVEGVHGPRKLTVVLVSDG